jgi:hypothetical protein
MFFLGLYSLQSGSILVLIAPSVIVGVPLGVYLIRRLATETFRGVCMSFDAWVVGFGFSRTLMDLGLLGDPAAYVVLLAAAGIDMILLYQFFAKRRRVELFGVRGRGRQPLGRGPGLGLNVGRGACGSSGTRVARDIRRAGHAALVRQPNRRTCRRSNGSAAQRRGAGSQTCQQIS